jgi:hypothetical protein
MRIVHVVDAAQAQAQVVQRTIPPTTSPPQRVQAINHQAGSDETSGGSTSPPDDGISLALSDEAQAAARQAMYEELRASRESKADDSGGESQESDPASQAEVKREKAEIQELEQTDHRIRTRGQAQATAAGNPGKVSYRYQVGPDGRLYVVSGEVSFDTSAVPDDPEATLRKAEQIADAAFVPGDSPSADRRAAIMAAMLKAEARRQLARQQESDKDTEDTADAADSVARVDQSG